jgi:outer membrane protein OmpA-like peptidoglycan-associated protein
MLKKLVKTGVVMSLLLMSTSAFAQAEYPSYNFWSNWELGFSVDLNHQFNRGTLFGDYSRWRGSYNAGMDIFAQKELTYWATMRLRFGLPNFWRPVKGFEKVNGDWQESNVYMDRHGSATIDMLVSINNIIYGYDPDRRWSVYAVLGAGGVYNRHPENSNGTYGKIGVMLDGGLGTSYRFTDHSSLFLEYTIDVNADVPNITKLPWHHTNGILRLGYFYNLGATVTDQAISAQRAMLTQENFGALNSQVNNLERQVSNSRANEKKLENRIAELEEQLAQALAQGGRGNCAAADSLQAVIDQIKADQLTFYAMPFSVQYGVDEWNVTDEEMAKVKAVGRVLKDNPSVKIMVVGFADYTGSDDYNMKLSEKRANEVKRLLVKKYGIAEDRIRTDYKGKSVAFGDIQYELNRRVSFYRVIE